MLLAAHLSYAEGVGELPLTLTYDPASSQYRLVDSVGQVVSSASGASANGRVEITGTEADDVLLLDLDYLPALQIDFLGGGTDTLAATANTDFALTGSTLTVGVTTFTLDGFERAELTGGV